MMEKNTMNKLLPGMCIVATIAIPACFLGTFIPLVGGPVCGILLGMMMAFWKRSAIYEAGILPSQQKS